MMYTSMLRRAFKSREYGDFPSRAGDGTMIGKRIRMERLMDKESRKLVIVPLDHGVSIGPVPGLVDFPHTVNEIARGGATCILMHKGLVEAGHRGHGKDIGLM